MMMFRFIQGIGTGGEVPVASAYISEFIGAEKRGRFFILYELEAPEVLDGPAYLARLNAPTPWSQRIMPQLGNFIRGGGIIVARAGRGEGSTIAALRIEHNRNGWPMLLSHWTELPPCRLVRPTWRGQRCRPSKRECGSKKGSLLGYLS